MNFFFFRIFFFGGGGGGRASGLKDPQFTKSKPHLSCSLRPSAWRLQWGWLEGHPAVKFRTKTPMNSQQLSLESCNSWETVQPVLAWTIHRRRLDAKCLVVIVVNSINITYYIIMLYNFIPLMPV